jgi:hypothetical protein
MTSWRNFYKDHETEKALNSSEVYRNYIQAALEQEKQSKTDALEDKLDEDYDTLQAVEQFNMKILENPKLKAKFKQARDYLETHPEVVSKVDPSFIKGLKLLDLEE